METVTLVTDESVTDLANAKRLILQLQAQITQKDEALARCKAAYTAIKQEFNDYRRYVQGTAANTKISPAAKLTAIRLPSVFNSAPGRKDKPAIKPGAPVKSSEEEPEPAPIFVGQIAKEIGMSDDAASKAIQELADAGAVVKQKHHQADGRTTLSIAPKLALLTNPRTIKPPEGQERNHGGKRIKCSSCGSDAILEYRKWVCSDCGQVVKEHDPRPVNPPPEDEVPPTLENSANRKMRFPEKFPVPAAEIVNPEITPVSTLYFDQRPTPERCEHPKHMQHQLNNGDWICSECGGRNEELLKWGGAS